MAGFFHDDALYIVGAKSLAEGRGYSVLSLPTPTPQTKYPVLFPALLSLLWRMYPSFPENVLFLKILPVVAGAVWLWISWRMLQRQSRNALFATVAIFFVAAIPYSIFLMTSLLSETLFAALTFGALWLLWRAEDGELAATVTAAFLASAAYHTRTIGACLVVAGALGLLLRRRYRLAFAFAGICVALIVPWAVWQASHAGGDDYLSSTNYYRDFNILTHTWPEIVTVVRGNLLFMLFQFSLLLFPLHLGLLWIPVRIFVPIISGALLVFGFFLKNKDDVILRLFVAIYMAVVIAWPWPPIRFVVPILPAIILLIWRGVPDGLHGCTIGTVAALSLIAIMATYSRSGLTRGAATPAPGVTGVDADEWREFQREVEWIRSNTPPDSVIGSHLDPTIYLYTGRHAVRGFHINAVKLWYSDRVDERPLGDATEFEKALDAAQVRYVVNDTLGIYMEKPFFKQLIGDLIRAHPNEMTPVWSGSRGGVIYRRTLNGLHIDESAPNTHWFGRRTDEKVERFHYR